MSRPRKRWLGLAAVALVAATMGLSAAACADPSTGTVTGHLTDAGSPVPDVQVFVYDLDATPVLIPASGTKTVNITATRPSP